MTPIQTPDVVDDAVELVDRISGGGVLAVDYDLREVENLRNPDVSHDLASLVPTKFESFELEDQNFRKFV